MSMLKKHQILEQAVEDYAETVHQLSKTSRALVADGHPERLVVILVYVMCCVVTVGLLIMLLVLVLPLQGKCFNITSSLVHVFPPFIFRIQ